MEKNDEYEEFDKALNDVLSGASSKFKSREQEENKEVIEKALSQFDRVPAPNRFNNYLNKFNDNEKNAIIDSFIDRDYPHVQDKWKIRTLYLNYRFYRVNLSNLITGFEGMVCSSDKERRLINYYIQTINKNVSIDKLFKNDWADVKEGSVSLWIDFIDSLTYLINGRNEQYLQAIIPLTKFYQ